MIDDKKTIGWTRPFSFFVSLPWGSGQSCPRVDLKQKRRDGDKKRHKSPFGRSNARRDFQDYEVFYQLDDNIIISFCPLWIENRLWLSADLHKDTTSSLQSTLSKTKPNCICFPQLFNHIFLHMSRKSVCVFNEKYVLNQWEAFSHGCVVLIGFHFLLQSSEFYWPFGLVFL